NGTLRETYTYSRFEIDGIQRYRIHTIEWPNDEQSNAQTNELKLLGFKPAGLSSAEDCHKTTFNFGTPFTNPDGGWTFGSTTVNNCAGDELHRVYLADELQGILYKQYCDTAPPVNGFVSPF